MADMKCCITCAEWKPATREYFYRNPRASSGLHGRCKPCYCAYQSTKRSEYRARDGDRVRELERRLAKVHRAARSQREKVKHHRSRARKAGVEGSFTHQEWVDLCAAYDNCCAACSSTQLLTIDHIVPLSLGGANVIDNLQPLCASCNSRKGQKVIRY